MDSEQNNVGLGKNMYLTVKIKQIRIRDALINFLVGFDCDYSNSSLTKDLLFKDWCLERGGS